MFDLLMTIALHTTCRLRISAGGQCTAMSEDGDSSIQGGVAVEQVLYDEARSTSGRMKFGLAKFGIADLFHEIFLCLIKQSKGKDIRASKVLYTLFAKYSLDT